MDSKAFHDQLVKKMDEYAHLVYRITKQFPHEELYGIVSQIRRASLSVVLNYLEGFARGLGQDKVKLNFFKISYGSLKESKYLLFFSYKENLLPEIDYNSMLGLADEIGAMLWTKISSLSNRLNK